MVEAENATFERNARNRSSREMQKKRDDDPVVSDSDCKTCFKGGLGDVLGTSEFQP